MTNHQLLLAASLVSVCLSMIYIAWALARTLARTLSRLPDYLDALAVKLMWLGMEYARRWNRPVSLRFSTGEEGDPLRATLHVNIGNRRWEYWQRGGSTTHQVGGQLAQFVRGPDDTTERVLLKSEPVHH